jgi:hypothetical protein
MARSEHRTAGARYPRAIWRSVARDPTHPTAPSHPTYAIYPTDPTCYDQAMSLDERDFFNSKNETRTDKLNCPRCKRVNEYQMRWVVNVKKDRLPSGADERDRALYAKLRDYMVRVDDAVTCKTCGKKFDIPSQHSMVFIEKGGAAAGPVFTGGDDEDSRFNR